MISAGLSFCFKEFRVCSNCDERDTTNHIPNQSRDQVRTDAGPERKGAGRDQIKCFDIPCDHVRQFGEANQVRQDNDHPNPRRFRKWQQPDHKGDQPPGNRAA